MNTLDIIIIGFCCLGAITGFMKGFIDQLIGFVGAFIAIWGSLQFHKIMEVHLLKQEWFSEGTLSIASLLITFLLLYIAVRITSYIIQKLIEAIGLGILNRIGGFILGGLIFLLIISSFLYYTSPLLTLLFKEASEKSTLLPHLFEFVNTLKNIIIK